MVNGDMETKGEPLKETQGLSGRTDMDQTKKAKGQEATKEGVGNFLFVGLWVVVWGVGGYGWDRRGSGANADRSKRASHDSPEKNH